MFSPYDKTTRDYKDLKIHGYDFAYEELGGSSFKESSVTNTDFSFSNLQHADLRFKKADECLFMLANMKNCKLNNVDLSTSRLDSAILKRADLRGTKLPAVHRREHLDNALVDRTTIIYLAYFSSLKDNEKENIDRQMPHHHQTSIDKILLFCLVTHNLAPELIFIILLNMIDTNHSSLYNFDILHQIIYQEQDYWKSIAPFKKDAPDCIELMKKRMLSLMGNATHFDEQWRQLRAIAQKELPTTLFYSKKLQGLYKAILNNSLVSYKLSLDNKANSHLNVEILYHIIYHNQRYWKQITPFTKGVPESINQMETILVAIGNSDLPPDAGWEKIKAIAQTNTESSFFFSEKLPPVIKKLHRAILNDSLNLFKIEIDHELNKSHKGIEQCSIQ
jgi:hypothetical protein